MVSHPAVSSPDQGARRSRRGPPAPSNLHKVDPPSPQRGPQDKRRVAAGDPQERRPKKLADMIDDADHGDTASFPRLAVRIADKVTSRQSGQRSPIAFTGTLPQLKSGRTVAWYWALASIGEGAKPAPGSYWLWVSSNATSQSRRPLLPE